MDKPFVTIELKNLLLSQIAQAGGTATTKDLLPIVERWREKAYSDMVRWALIRMAEKGWLARPFGNMSGGKSQGRRNWLRSNRPNQNTNQQVWEITDAGRKYIDEIWVDTVIIPEELQAAECKNIIEGAVKAIIVNSYERNPEARKQCIEHHGYTCAVCGFDFSKAYGMIGTSYIHVHHVKSLSEIKAQYKVNPVEDLCPVCPNCHAMLHRRQPPFSVEELRQIITENESSWDCGGLR